MVLGKLASHMQKAESRPLINLGPLDFLFMNMKLGFKARKSKKPQRPENIGSRTILIAAAT